MKRSFNSNHNLSVLSYAVLLLLCLNFLEVYGQEQTQTSYPLVKADSTKLYIGNYSIDFNPSTFKDIDGSTTFPYDSIASHHDFDQAINSFFNRLAFKNQKEYNDLKDAVQGWNYSEVLDQLNVSRIGSNINLRWRSLPLRDAIASALIAYVQSDPKYHLYIDNGQLDYIYIRDSKVIAIDSIANTIALKTVAVTVGPIIPIQEDSASGRELWLYVILVFLLIALGLLAYLFLQKQKNSLSIDEIALLQKGQFIEGEHRLSQKNKTLLNQIKHEITYKTEGGNENEVHKKIILNYMDLVEQLKNKQGSLTTLETIGLYLKGNDLSHTAAEIQAISTFLAERETLQNQNPKDTEKDALLLRILQLFYRNTEDINFKKLEGRLDELQALEKNTKQLITHTKTTSFSHLSSTINTLFTPSNTQENGSKMLETLALFNFEEQDLRSFNETLKIAPLLTDLSDFLSTKKNQTEDFSTRDLLTNLNLLFHKLKILVPGMTQDHMLLSTEILKAALFQKFFEELQYANQEDMPLDIPKVVESVRTTYNQQKPEEIAFPNFQLSDFIEKELKPYMNLISKTTLDYEQENQYLLQFHQRYHNLLTKLESAQVLEEEDRIWFFETLFSISFHILDYVKIKLALPKTDGADINFGLILEGNNIQDLSSEAYDVITKNYRTTPIEVRHILKLAQQVGIKKLDDLLFNGVYINPESLNDTTDEKN